jgi:hypothetical protein
MLADGVLVKSAAALVPSMREFFAFSLLSLIRPGLDPSEEKHRYPN